jgi:hypothetical protein
MGKVPNSRGKASHNTRSRKKAALAAKEKEAAKKA